MDVRVEIHCEACGSANYSLPAGERRRRADPLQRLRRRPGHDRRAAAALCSQQVLDHAAEALRARTSDRLLTRRRSYGRMAACASSPSPLSPCCSPSPPRRSSSRDVSAADRAAHERMIVLDTHLDIAGRFDDGRLGFRPAATATPRTAARSICRGWTRAGSMAASSSSTRAQGAADAGRLCRGARRGAGARRRDPPGDRRESRPDRPRRSPPTMPSGCTRAGRRIAFHLDGE